MDIASLSSEPAVSQALSETTSLGKDDFLNLIVTQMQNQNPLEPTSSTEFMAQLTQLGTLEQIQNINGNITGLFGDGSSNAMASAARLVGLRIEYLDAATGEVLPGVVSAVSRQNGEVMLDVGTGDPVPLGDIVRVLDGADAGGE